MKALLTFLGMAVFFAWAFISPLWGAIAVSASAMATLIFAWAFSDYSIATGIILFAVMAAIAHYLRLKMQDESQAAAVKIEEIQKSRNMLKEGLFSHKGVQEALKKKLRRFFQLKELMSDLSVRLDAADAANTVAEAAFGIIGKADSCYFYVVDKERQQLALIAAKQKSVDAKVKNRTGDIFDLWTFKQRQALFIEDVRKDYRFDIDKGASAAGSNFKSLISTPIITDEKITGSLRLNSNKANVFLADDLRLLDIISNLSGAALENASLYTRTKELAIRDSLTGAYVQKFFKDRLAEEVARALRGNYNTSVLFIDIDFFKAYNDRYGHAAGDLVLKKAANILMQFTQDSGDIVARYGGEEFAVILANKDKNEAVGFAEEARKRIEEEVFLLRRQESRVTVSAGVAACPEDASISQDLMKAADDALYKAKKQGRNCVAVK